MRLVIQENSEQVADWAARYVLKRIKDFNPGPDKYFVMGLPTGNDYYAYQFVYHTCLTLIFFCKYREHSSRNVPKAYWIPPSGL